MMEKQEVLQLHERLNERFFGASGLRDERALEAALARPLASFGGDELYPGPLEKAAALAESLTKNHPFVEGNMRTAYVLMRLQLLEAGLDLSAGEEERQQLMLALATSRMHYSQLLAWLQQHTKRAP
ncbi:type II toxin-antitoxin system death-on-curing family toxin [Cesiribacter andamanensis]|uniref:Protein involved in cell division n=1 Tax=Cesiribacter andamanensis AMV16 TaxID=1279009 RepID=M7NZQ0_9BACT|nr:type II toxin-antitoxin system death-on-curing family toxin [Cesiribacter andamanensis]EMR03824.1 Protein involved in cell division [Cesiribacter andamanensis AMV16]